MGQETDLTNLQFVETLHIDPKGVNWQNLATKLGRKVSNARKLIYRIFLLKPVLKSIQLTNQTVTLR